MIKTLVDYKLSYIEKDHEKFNMLCNAFSTKFIKNILTSVNFYIDPYEEEFYEAGDSIV